MFKQSAPWCLITGLLWGCGQDDPSPARADSMPSDGGSSTEMNSDAAVDAAAPDADVPVGGDGDMGEVVKPCESIAGSDQDGDLFKAGVDDCNDCDPYVNPGAFDVPGNHVDEDCSGKADDEPRVCDQGLAIASDDPFAAAKSLGLCRVQKGSSWGLKSAQWTFPDGTKASIDKDFCEPNRPPFPLGHGLLPSYGNRVKPRDGASMLALASGVARAGRMELGQEWLPARGFSPDSVTACLPSYPPMGFPTWTSACGTKPADSINYVYDGMALEIEIQVPTNATELKFDFNFYSSEFPQWVCDGKSDQFVALLYSSHPKTPANHNISFDGNGNVVSVDGAFMRVCEANTLGSRSFACPLGASELEGTGIDVRMLGDEGPYLQGGATSWLTTRAPVVPGEVIKLRFAIWDSDDDTGDSTVLIDSLGFTVAEGKGQPPPVKEPVTEPVILF